MHSICYFLLLATSSPLALQAQSITTRVEFVTFKDEAFGFSQRKTYPWYILRHEDGTFENTTGEKTEAADTIPLPVTAHCKTNVQGAYVMDECNARVSGDTTWLEFGGGMPAYASSFTALLIRDSVTVTASFIYPSPRAPKLVRVLKQALKMERRPGLLRGYIDFTFLMEGSMNKYYLKGFFSTPIVPDAAGAAGKNDHHPYHSR